MQSTSVGLSGIEIKPTVDALKHHSAIMSLPFLGLSKKCKQLLTPEYFKNGLFFLLLAP